MTKVRSDVDGNAGPSTAPLTPPSMPALRAVRKAQGLTLRAAAGRAGIDPAHLSRVERGERALSLDALRRLAVVLGLNDLAQRLALCLPEAES